MILQKQYGNLQVLFFFSLSPSLSRQKCYINIVSLTGCFFFLSLEPLDGPVFLKMRRGFFLDLHKIGK